MSIVRFERRIVQFTENISVDGYRMPNGEFRVGLIGASKALGFSRKWLPQLLTRGGSALNALQNIGFTAEQTEGVVSRDDASGASTVNTISLRDFGVLVIHGVQQGKTEAIAMNLAFLEMSLSDFFRDAFGEAPLTIDEKRELFYKAYAETINWMKEDRKDVESLWLAGDPQELKDWNNSINWLS